MIFVPVRLCFETVIETFIYVFWWVNANIVYFHFRYWCQVKYLPLKSIFIPLKPIYFISIFGMFVSFCEHHVLQHSSQFHSATSDPSKWSKGSCSLIRVSWFESDSFSHKLRLFTSTSENEIESRQILPIRVASYYTKCICLHIQVKSRFA